MKTVELKVTHRETLGKGYAKRIRKEGRIPAILYGHELPPITLEVDLKSFQKVLKTGAGSNVVLSLKIAGLKKDNEHTAIIKDIQRDPVHEALTHVDFNAISLTEKIRVSVPVHVKGEAPGVKEGGILEHVHREIEVECLPTEIPEKFDVSVDQLNIGDSLHVSDLVFPAGVVCTLDAGEPILTVLSPMKEEVVAPTEEAVAGSEPEVIGKKKEEPVEGAVAGGEKGKAQPAGK
jgi:large subunit ribosomal protein L25